MVKERIIIVYMAARTWKYAKSTLKKLNNQLKYKPIQQHRDILRGLNARAYSRCPCREQPLDYYSRDVCNAEHQIYFAEYMRVFFECVNRGLNYYEEELNDTQALNTHI